jgi:hypothetical protein
VDTEGNHVYGNKAGIPSKLKKVRLGINLRWMQASCSQQP